MTILDQHTCAEVEALEILTSTYRAKLVEQHEDVLVLQRKVQIRDAEITKLRKTVKHLERT